MVLVQKKVYVDKILALKITKLAKKAKLSESSYLRLIIAAGMQ